MDTSFIRISSRICPQKAVKGQVLANFLADHPSQTESQEIMELGMASVEPWQMWFDGSRANGLTGIGIVIKSPQGIETTHGFRVDETTCSNNQAEYEALIVGLEILIGLQVHAVDIFGDSQLVVNQVKGIFKC